MKATRLKWFLVFLLASGVFQLPAQQSEADRKLLADVRAKAEKGEAQSQYELGKAFYGGSLGVLKDEAEAVKVVSQSRRAESARCSEQPGPLLR